MEINGILYFRRQAVAWKYPDLIHGEGKDYHIYNMNRDPESPDYGKEKIDWNTEEYPKPTDSEMMIWFNEVKVYKPAAEQLWYDIDSGLFGDNAKTGQFYLENKSAYLEK